MCVGGFFPFCPMIASLLPNDTHSHFTPIKNEMQMRSRARCVSEVLRVDE